MKTLDQKIYQLIISRLDGERLSSTPYRDRAFELVRKGIGGFIVFGGDKDETRDFIDELQAASDTLLFIASDIERGVGQQINGATNFPSQMAVAAAIGKDAGLFTDMIRAIAAEAVDVGINMALIPVLDVNTNPANPIICTRAFSDNPQEVARLGRIYIKTVEESGLLSCAKHFPGHGDTSIDSHIALPVISKSIKELTVTDIRPFQEAIKQGVGSIMVGHISVPAVDSLPATISKKIVTGLLRTKLGYEGLILTDALNMHALEDVKDICSKSLNAGADILLHPADADDAATELKDAVESGMVKQERIDDANERIFEHKFGIRNPRGTEPDYRRNKRLCAQITDRSITLVKTAPGLLPVTVAQGLSVVIAAEGNDDTLRQSPLKEFLPGASRFYYPGSGDLVQAVSGQTLVVAIFTSVAAWKGSSGIEEKEKNILKELIEKSRKVIVVSFGSPYVLRDFPEADVLVAAYDKSIEAQRSVVKCLTGEQDFKGSLPVDLCLP